MDQLSIVEFSLESLNKRVVETRSAAEFRNLDQRLKSVAGLVESIRRNVEDSGSSSTGHGAAPTPKILSDADKKRLLLQHKARQSPGKGLGGLGVAIHPEPQPQQPEQEQEREQELGVRRLPTVLVSISEHKPEHLDAGNFEYDARPRRLTREVTQQFGEIMKEGGMDAIKQANEGNGADKIDSDPNYLLQKAKAREAFKILDKNGDGYLRKEVSVCDRRV